MKESGGVMRSGSIYVVIVSLSVLVIAGLAGAPAWSAEKAADPVQAGAGKTIVEVNGLPLTQGEVDQKVNRTIESLKDQIPPDQLEEFKKNVQGKIVDDFINRTIISQEMDKQKITADEGEVQKALDEVASKVPQGMTLEAMLKQGGITMDEMKDNIRFSLRANKLFESQVKSDYVPTAEEISTYYNENKKKYDMPE